MEIRVKKYSLKQARKNLPIRKRADNKTHGGKCLIIAGSQGLWGAAILCAEAAARVGTGYVYVYDSKNKFPIFKNPDFLTLKEPVDYKIFRSVAIGPGLKSTSIIPKQLKKLSQIKFQQVVLDAEALNFISSHPDQYQLQENWILTPHEGELARLLKLPSQLIQKNRRKYAVLAQKKFGCIIVLKGFRTLVASKNGLWENQSGNSSLAKAGTGDVLTGMIAGFLSQGLESLEAAKLSVFIHGSLADHWVGEGNDLLSLMARDLLSMLPKVLKNIRSK